MSLGSVSSSMPPLKLPQAAKESLVVSPRLLEQARRAVDDSQLWKNSGGYLKETFKSDEEETSMACEVSFNETACLKQEEPQDASSAAVGRQYCRKRSVADALGECSDGDGEQHQKRPSIFAEKIPDEGESTAEDEFCDTVHSSCVASGLPDRNGLFSAGSFENCNGRASLTAANKRATDTKMTRRKSTEYCGNLQDVLSKLSFESRSVATAHRITPVLSSEVPDGAEVLETSAVSASNQDQRDSKMVRLPDGRYAHVPRGTQPVLLRIRSGAESVEHRKTDQEKSSATGTTYASSLSPTPGTPAAGGLHELLSRGSQTDEKAAPALLSTTAEPIPPLPPFVLNHESGDLSFVRGVWKGTRVPEYSIVDVGLTRQAQICQSSRTGQLVLVSPLRTMPPQAAPHMNTELRSGPLGQQSHCATGIQRQPSVLPSPAYVLPAQSKRGQAFHDIGEAVTYQSLLHRLAAGSTAPDMSSAKPLGHDNPNEWMQLLKEQVAWRAFCTLLQMTQDGKPSSTVAISGQPTWDRNAVVNQLFSTLEKTTPNGKSDLSDGVGMLGRSNSTASTSAGSVDDSFGRSGSVASTRATTRKNSLTQMKAQDTRDESSLAETVMSSGVHSASSSVPHVKADEAASTCEGASSTTNDTTWKTSFTPETVHLFRVLASLRQAGNGAGIC